MWTLVAESAAATISGMTFAADWLPAGAEVQAATASPAASTTASTLVRNTRKVMTASSSGRRAIALDTPLAGYSNVSDPL
jgi:hypothetical protein